MSPKERTERRADHPGSDASTPSQGFGRAVARRLRPVPGNALVLLGLWGLAVAQPLLDLYGRNGELLVAAGQQAGDVVRFALLVTLVVPVGLTVIEALAHLGGRRVGAAVHAILVAVLSAALACVFLRKVDPPTLVTILLAITFAVVVAAGERRWRGLRLGLRYLGVAPLLFLAVFVWFSRTSSLIFTDEVESTEGVRIGEPRSIVMLQLDELPLAALLRDDLSINADRFPRFAELAGEATWYRQATSQSANTHLSVPSVVTGQIPDPNKLPTWSDHPQSLFSLLGEQYEMNVEQAILDLCPPSACGDQTQSKEPLSAILADAAVVYGHVALPQGLRGDLPRVDGSWGGFLGDDATDATEASEGSGDEAVVTGAPAVGERTSSEPLGEGWQDLPAFTNGPAGQGSVLRDSIASIPPPGPEGSSPTLTYAHVLLPHRPWSMTPSGQEHSEPGIPRGLGTDGHWYDDERFAREGLQRHLLQVGYTDLLLGELMDHMKQNGSWDDSLVVVLSDHGSAFEPGESRRDPIPSTVHEIYNVPLFIKYPNQTQGETVDTNARLIDVLPTIIDALDIEVDWDLDGESLLGDSVPPDDKPVAEAEMAGPVSSGTDGILEVVRRNERYLPYGDTWWNLHQIDPYGDLLGASVADLDVGEPSPMSWSTFRPVLAYDPAGAHSAVMQVGLLDTAGGAVPTGGLLAVNGTVAGFLSTFEASEDGWQVSALLVDDFFQYGYNDLELLKADVDGGRRFHEVTLISY